MWVTTNCDCSGLGAKLVKDYEEEDGVVIQWRNLDNNTWHKKAGRGGLTLCTIQNWFDMHRARSTTPSQFNLMTGDAENIYFN